jgi:divinyl protochlorophyllide a 8-vinyl-reductase
MMQAHLAASNTKLTIKPVQHASPTADTPAPARLAGRSSSIDDADARIGPNAILRIREALEHQSRDSPDIATDITGAEAVFAAAGLQHYLRDPPDAMVPEDHVTALQDALRASLCADDARTINQDAGARTARYLLTHRIPKPAQWIMRMLPAAASARFLISAIGHHSWTFAGSGHFASQPNGKGINFSIQHCPYCRGNEPRAKPSREPNTDPDLETCSSHAPARSATPQCSYVASTFETLFRVLVHSDSVVTEVACEALGDEACLFEARWP